MRTPNLKLLWGLTFLFLTGGAYLSARVTAVSLARKFWVAEAQSVSASVEESHRELVESLADYRVISERNLFNPHPAPPPPPPPPPPPRVAIAPPIPPPPPLLPPPLPPPPPPEPPPPDLKVVGTAVVNGGNSFALIASGQELRVVKEKDEIVPGAVLVQVRSDRIVVSWRGKNEEYPLFEERRFARAAVTGAVGPVGPVVRGPQRPRPQPQPEAPAAPAADTHAAPGQDTVRQTGDDKWTIAKAEVESLRTDMGAMMTQVRVVPNFTDGQPDGFKVFAIRPGSLFAKIGLQNGDVIKNINGIAIQTPEQAMAAYQRLSSETSIKIELVRRNENKTLTYDIR